MTSWVDSERPCIDASVNTHSSVSSTGYPPTESDSLAFCLCLHSSVVLSTDGRCEPAFEISDDLSCGRPRPFAILFVQPLTPRDQRRVGTHDDAGGPGLGRLGWICGTEQYPLVVDERQPHRERLYLRHDQQRQVRRLEPSLHVLGVRPLRRQIVQHALRNDNLGLRVRANNLVTDPALVQQVLVDDDVRYRRPEIRSGQSVQLTENGLIDSDGPLWEAQRTRLASLFAPEQLETYAETIATVFEAVTADWSDGDRVDLYDAMAELTVRVISRTLFSRPLSDAEVQRFTAANATIGAEFEFAPTSLLRQLTPAPASSEYRKAVTWLHEWANALIAERRAAADLPDDLVTTMVQAEQDPEVNLPANQVRDEVLTFLFAGHETTALTLAYTLWYLGHHSAVADRVRTEVQAVCDGQAVPDYAALADLDYTEQVIKEALRLRPPSWSIFRQATLDSRLGRTRIERDDYLLVPQWTLHRDGRFFDDPETFDPSRWTDRAASDTPAYFPFGAGPHACIGRQLALTEAQLVVAGLLAQFDIETAAESIDGLRPAGVLQPRGEVTATIQTR